MKLNENDLYLLSQTAVSAAYQAGHLISENYNKKLTVKKKTAGDSLATQVVTQVDIMSQEIILNTIKPTCDIYDLALLTEETPDDLSRQKKDYFWCIDPLDGTLPFIESRPGFAVSIALVSKTGIPQIGVIYDPIEKNLYQSVIGQGAYKNGKLIKRNDLYNDSEKLVTLYFNDDLLEYGKYKECIDKIKNNFNEIEIVKPGGAVMNACWVLENAPSFYFKFPRKKLSGGSLWDYSATACLFNEIGAWSTDVFGNPLDLNRPDSTFMNHKGYLYASDKKLGEKVLKILSKFII